VLCFSFVLLLFLTRPAESSADPLVVRLHQPISLHQ
jgi:hypothetical protein